MMVNGMPRMDNNSFRLGDCDANTKFIGLTAIVAHAVLVVFCSSHELSVI